MQRCLLRIWVNFGGYEMRGAILGELLNRVWDLGPRRTKKVKEMTDHVPGDDPD